MEYIIILGLCIIVIFVLKYAFQVKIKEMKKIKEIGYDKQLNEITSKLPDNKTVCEEILKKLDNVNVKIEEIQNKDRTLTYYSVITNHIMIANIKDTFTRIQTIAHECLHSVQNRKMLLFNFIFSNIYILYFITISILTIFGLVSMPMIQVGILLLLGIVYYAIRAYLEVDVMTRAPYVAKEYMQEKGVLSKEEIEIVMKNHEILNKIGIPMTQFELCLKVISKIIIYCVIAMSIMIIS